MINKHLLAALVCTSTASIANASVVLSSDFTAVDPTDTVAPFTAANITWDTVNGINTPAGELTFTDPGGGDVDGFFSTANEIAVDYNMTSDGPWTTSLALVLDGSTASIDLTTVDVGLRLTNNAGANNSTSSKNGRTTIELIGSVSGSLGLVDPGNSNYPSVEYTRNIDVSALPSLDTSEDYTLVITTFGTGFGHNKSLQALAVNGDITPIPEPGSLALLGLGGLLVARRRRG